MGLEDVVERILSSRRDLTRDEVLKMIEEKKASAEEFFTDEAAARMIASDLKVEIPTEPLQPRLEIKNLISGLNDVTVTGRIIIIYPPQTFTRSDLTEGRVARLLIADRSGTLRVVLWDEKASIVENGEIKQGQIAKFSHGYIRKGFDGKLDLHTGSRGEIRSSPPDADENAYPPLTQFLKKIGEITKKDREANIVGIIQRVYPVSTFKRQDGTDGKVRRLRLGDETGQITAVFWNQKVDELRDVKKEEYLQIMGARVKEGLNGQIELHVEDRTQIQTLAELPPKFGSLPKLSSRFTKITEIKDGTEPINVEGSIETNPTIREVTTSRGERVMVASFQLRDETGKIWVSVWRRLVDVVKDLKAGTRIKIKNAYVRNGFSNQLELTSHSLTSIEVS
ncbi:MAG: OB-fold nucleic acid binding domain-containing protein [Candidatus Bathyarchaeia archaeon]